MKLKRSFKTEKALKAVNTCNTRPYFLPPSPPLEWCALPAIKRFMVDGTIYVCISTALDKLW
jgi:hypothetical protein